MRTGPLITWWAHTYVWMLRSQILFLQVIINIGRKEKPITRFRFLVPDYWYRDRYQYFAFHKMTIIMMCRMSTCRCLNHSYTNTDLSVKIEILRVLNYLSIYLCIYLSICLPLSLCIYLSINPSIYLCIYLSFYLSMHLSVYLCIYLYLIFCLPFSSSFSSSFSVSMHVCKYLSIYLSTNLPIYECMNLSVNLTIYVCILSSDLWEVLVTANSLNGTFVSGFLPSLGRSDL